MAACRIEPSPLAPHTVRITLDLPRRAARSNSVPDFANRATSANEISHVA
jgi:hypothetical protein